VALWPEGLAVFEQAVSRRMNLRERAGHAATTIAWERVPSVIRVTRLHILTAQI
jgi:hypothetical protein